MLEAQKSTQGHTDYARVEFLRLPTFPLLSQTEPSSDCFEDVIVMPSMPVPELPGVSKASAVLVTGYNVLKSPAYFYG